MNREALLKLIDANASDDELYALYMTLIESKGKNPTISDEVFSEIFPEQYQEEDEIDYMTIQRFGKRLAENPVFT